MNAGQASNSLPPAPEGPGPRCAGRHFGHHHHFHHHRRGHGVVLGLTVVAWGALLLARELGHLPASLHALDFWPLLLIGWGVDRVLRRYNVGHVLLGLFVAAVGASFLAQKLGYAGPQIGRYWPLIVIAGGLALLLKGTSRRGPRPHGHGDETVSDGVLERSVTMGGLKLVVDSQEFKGARLQATMGGVEIDLRRAAMAGDEATVEVALVMSGVELHVPGNWVVVNEISPFMGAVEDQTTPPAEAGPRKRLILRGTMSLGAVAIKN